jgi:excisionase family DNA binding protein
MLNPFEQVVRRVSVAEAARLTGFTESQLRNAIEDGRLSVERYGRKVFILEDELKRFVAVAYLVK